MDWKWFWVNIYNICRVCSTPAVCIKSELELIFFYLISLLNYTLSCYMIVFHVTQHPVVIEMLSENLLVHFMNEVVFVCLVWISNCLCFSSADDLSMAKEAHCWDEALIISSNLLNLSWISLMFVFWHTYRHIQYMLQFIG